MVYNAVSMIVLIRMGWMSAKCKALSPSPISVQCLSLKFTWPLSVLLVLNIYSNNLKAELPYFIEKKHSN